MIIDVDSKLKVKYSPQNIRLYNNIFNMYIAKSYAKRYIH